MWLKSQKYWLVLFSGLIIWLLFSCEKKPEMADEALLKQAREIHQRIFTVDTHCDTPGNMVRSDWDIGQRHEPG
ncbi:MAG: hypothetical protein DRI99_05400, partial [Candidatus Aminicenantes bacterium]